MHGFDWLSGVAAIDLPCPPAMLARNGLSRFFNEPNAEDWGSEAPRILMHECLHVWQLVGSRWLLAMVAEEWGRLQDWQPGAPPSSPGPLRQAYGRPDHGQLFSVRDLVECLARFWDVHIRGPQRLLDEEGDDLGGLRAMIAARRDQEGHGGYASLEFDALMIEGRQHAAYAAPYRWLLDRAKQAPAVANLPLPIDQAASWTANLLLPVAGFVALNAATPIATFVAAVDRLLQPDAVGMAATRRHPLYKAINLDWLIVWPVLLPGVVRALRRSGHAIEIDTAHLNDPGIASHPIWCHLRQRFDSLRRGLAMLLAHQGDEEEGPMQVVFQFERQVYGQDPWAVLALPGQPNCRALLGSVFSPPLLQFVDTSLSASETAPWFAAWPLDDAQLRAAVATVDERAVMLRQAMAAARYGLPPNAFHQQVT